VLKTELFALALRAPARPIHREDLAPDILIYLADGEALLLGRLPAADIGLRPVPKSTVYFEYDVFYRLIWGKS
jgi:hypothetical protein